MSANPRNACIWAYQEEVVPVCPNARLDSKTGLSYPMGNERGQAGWDVGLAYKNLDDLAAKLSGGLDLPAEFCGNLIVNCGKIPKGEIVRLAIMAHGDQGGQFFVEGRDSKNVLTAENIPTFRSALLTIGACTKVDATLLLIGCLAGQGERGTRLLVGLSQMWPGRQVVGFTTLGYRHPGAMKLGKMCMAPGMRDTDAPAELYSNPRRWDSMWSDFSKLPWASEKSPNAKVARNGLIEHCPPNELCDPKALAQPAQRPSPVGKR